MAIFNTARLRDVLVRGSVAKDPGATDFVEELDSQTEKVLSSYGTLDRIESMESRILLAIAKAEQHRAEMEARLADMAAQQARHINQSVGIVLAGIALAVGIILGFG